MYLTTAYPNHPYTKVLLQKMQNAGYENWASRMKTLVQQREAILQQTLNEDRRYDAMLRTTEHTVQRILSIDNTLSALTRQFIQLRDFLEKEKFNVAQSNAVIINPQVTPMSQNHITNSITINDITPVNLEAHAFRTSLEDPPITNTIRTSINMPIQPQNSEGIPIIPVIPMNIHKTVTENMEYWIMNKYYKYLERNGVSLHHLGWPRTLQQRFCKRRDIAMWVKTVGENVWDMTLDWEADSHIFPNIARVLDEERGSKTVMVAVEEFKSENQLSWKKGRKKKHKSSTS